MLKTLVRIRLRALADSMFNRKRGGKKGGVGSKVLMGVLMVYCVVVFFGMFGLLFSSLCQPLDAAGLRWLYFALAGLLAAMLCFIGSVFFTQSTIFDAKDNDLLLSLPVRPGAILGSRLLTLLLLNYAYSLVIILPCGVVWCMLMPVSAVGVLLYVVCALLLPLLPSALSCVVGWAIALISSRMRNKNLFTLILSFGFLAAYFYIYANAQQYIQQLIANGAAVAEAVRTALPPFYAMGLAVAEGNLLRLGLFALWCVIPFAAIYALLARSFIRIATMKRGMKKIKYQAREMRASGVRWALTVKEMRHFFSNAMYMMNAAIGVVMILICAGAVVIKRADLLALLTQEFSVGFDITPWVAPLACAVLCGISAFNMVSAPSVSLEGKNLWLAQSIPVKAGDILLAKAYAHMIICAPAGVLASLAFILALPMDVAGAVFVVLLPLLVTAFSALVGVAINLRMPRFDYINDTIAVKQGASSIVTMLCCMGIVAAPILLYTLAFKAAFSVNYMLLGYAAALLIACALLYGFLARGAEQTFARLDQD